MDQKLQERLEKAKITGVKVLDVGSKEEQKIAYCIELLTDSGVTLTETWMITGAEQKVCQENANQLQMLTVLILLDMENVTKLDFKGLRWIELDEGARSKAVDLVGKNVSLIFLSNLEEKKEMLLAIGRESGELFLVLSRHYHERNMKVPGIYVWREDIEAIINGWKEKQQDEMTKAS